MTTSQGDAPGPPTPPPWSLALGAATYTLALAARLHQLDAARVLGDTLGPYLNGLVSPLRWVPHAEPYGWALAPPYALSLALAGSLRGAVACILGWQALVAPLAAALVWRLSPRSWAAALAAGLLLALDGGLLDTARAGSEAYLGPMWLGLAALGVAAGDRGWGPTLAFSAFAVACMNHPFAVCALPLLTALPLRSRSTWIGAGLGLGMMAPRLWRLAQLPLPDAGGALGRLGDVVPAYLDQGGLVAWLLLASPFIALLREETRGWALRVLASVAALFVLGALSGYLRDHHLRLLSVPLAGCLAAIPNRAALLSLLLLRPPPSHMPPPGAPAPPGSLALAEAVARDVAQRAGDGPLVVDRAWLSGPASVEPAAVVLDLYLRGWPRERFAPGGEVALIVAGAREDLERLGFDVASWDGSAAPAVWVDSAPALRARTAALCGHPVRMGGAWDGLAVMRPQTSFDELKGWWAPCLLAADEGDDQK